VLKKRSTSNSAQNLHKRSLESLKDQIVDELLTLETAEQEQRARRSAEVADEEASVAAEEQTRVRRSFKGGKGAKGEKGWAEPAPVHGGF
jgi:hypothetical protein